MECALKGYILPLGSRSESQQFGLFVKDSPQVYQICLLSLLNDSFYKQILWINLGPNPSKCWVPSIPIYISTAKGLRGKLVQVFKEEKPDMFERVKTFKRV